MPDLTAVKSVALPRRRHRLTARHGREIAVMESGGHTKLPLSGRRPTVPRRTADLKTGTLSAIQKQLWLTGDAGRSCWQPPPRSKAANDTRPMVSAARCCLANDANHPHPAYPRRSAHRAHRPAKGRTRRYAMFHLRALRTLHDGSSPVALTAQQPSAQGKRPGPPNPRRNHRAAPPQHAPTPTPPRENRQKPTSSAAAPTRQPQSVLPTAISAWRDARDSGYTALRDPFMAAG